MTTWWIDAIVRRWAGSRPGHRRVDARVQGLDLGRCTGSSSLSGWMLMAKFLIWVDALGHLLILVDARGEVLDLGGRTVHSSWFGWMYWPEILNWNACSSPLLDMDWWTVPSWFGWMQAQILYLYGSTGPSSWYEWMHTFYWFGLMHRAIYLIWLNCWNQFIDLDGPSEIISRFVWMYVTKYLIWMDGWSQFYILVDALDQLLDFDCTTEPFFIWMDGRWPPYLSGCMHGTNFFI